MGCLREQLGSLGPYQDPLATLKDFGGNRESQMNGNNVLNHELYNYQLMASVLDCVCFEVDNICHMSQVKSIETRYTILDIYIKNISKGAIGSEMQ